jgi:hypothetical protein
MSLRFTTALLARFVPPLSLICEVEAKLPQRCNLPPYPMEAAIVGDHRHSQRKGFARQRPANSSSGCIFLTVRLVANWKAGRTDCSWPTAVDFPESLNGRS